MCYETNSLSKFEINRRKRVQEDAIASLESKKEEMKSIERNLLNIFLHNFERMKETMDEYYKAVKNIEQQEYLVSECIKHNKYE